MHHFLSYYCTHWLDAFYVKPLMDIRTFSNPTVPTSIMRHIFIA